MTDTMTETINAAPPIVISDTTMIVVAICVTIILLTLIVLIGKFRITGPNGMSIEVGTAPAKKPNNPVKQPDKPNEGVIGQNEKQPLSKEQ
jgi:hypothetical protein